MKQKRRSWKNEIYVTPSPDENCFSPDLHFCSSTHPSPLLRSQEKRPHHPWLQIPKLLPHRGRPSLAGKRTAALRPHTASSPSFPGMASGRIKSSFFTEQPQPRLSLWMQRYKSWGFYCMSNSMGISFPAQIQTSYSQPVQDALPRDSGSH